MARFSKRSTMVRSPSPLATSPARARVELRPAPPRRIRDTPGSTNFLLTFVFGCYNIGAGMGTSSWKEPAA